ncbi:MAG: 5,6-dimethylbenzimidazole synthase [Rhodospirillaceae bacterium]
MKPSCTEAPPVFDDAFRAAFVSLLEWRRDVRRFKPDPVDPALVEKLLHLAVLAPSVGNSQPWRFVMVEDAGRRAAVRASFEECNAEALHAYSGEQAQLYAKLKLSGLDIAPVQIAVYCDTVPLEGAGLGRRTMPETLQHSVAAAVQTMALASRAWGLGLGIVTILDPRAVTRALDVPEEWSFVGYLCLGWPEEEHRDPELVRYGWQDRLPFDRTVIRR